MCVTFLLIPTVREINRPMSSFSTGKFLEGDYRFITTKSIFERGSFYCGTAAFENEFKKLKF